VVRIDDVHRRRIFYKCSAYRRSVAEVNATAKNLNRGAKSDADLWVESMRSCGAV
jgi:hypothetical protein